MTRCARNQGLTPSSVKERSGSTSASVSCEHKPSQWNPRWLSQHSRLCLQQFQKSVPWNCHSSWPEGNGGGCCKREAEWGRIWRDKTVWGVVCFYFILIMIKTSFTTHFLNTHHFAFFSINSRSRALPWTSVDQCFPTFFSHGKYVIRKKLCHQKKTHQWHMTDSFVFECLFIFALFLTYSIYCQHTQTLCASLVSFSHSEHSEPNPVCTQHVACPQLPL